MRRGRISQTRERSQKWRRGVRLNLEERLPLGKERERERGRGEPD